MSGYTAREKARSQRSLICLLQALTGMTVTIELKDDSIVIGRVEHVDGFMSLEMTDAQLKTINDEKVIKFDAFFVHGKSLRYVQIPDHVDMVRLMETQLSRSSQRVQRAKVMGDIYRAKRVKDERRQRQAERVRGRGRGNVAQ